jgi:hypothetical protein
MAALQAALQANLPAALQAALPAALQAALPAALNNALADLYIMTAQVSATSFIIPQCSNDSQNHNRIVVDGLSVRFYEVRYPNGDRPTQHPVCFFIIYIYVILSYLSLYQHNLPLLDSTDTIDDLQPGEMVAYIHGYRPGIVVPRNRDARIRLIKLAIGCSLD